MYLSTIRPNRFASFFVVDHTESMLPHSGVDYGWLTRRNFGFLLYFMQTIEKLRSIIKIKWSLRPQKNCWYAIISISNQNARRLYQIHKPSLDACNTDPFQTCICQQQYLEPRAVDSSAEYSLMQKTWMYMNIVWNKFVVKIILCASISLNDHVNINCLNQHNHWAK